MTGPEAMPTGPMAIQVPQRPPGFGSVASFYVECSFPWARKCPSGLPGFSDEAYEGRVAFSGNGPKGG